MCLRGRVGVCFSVMVEIREAQGSLWNQNRIPWGRRFESHGKEGKRIPGQVCGFACSPGESVCLGTCLSPLWMWVISVHIAFIF